MVRMRGFRSAAGTASCPASVQHQHAGQDSSSPAWKDSLNADGGAMSFFEGGFLPDFMNALQFWYDHGIRMFKFDSSI